MLTSEIHQRPLKGTQPQEEDQEQLDAQQLLDEHEDDVDIKSVWNYTPLRQARFLGHLFFGRKFFMHRFTGLIYLLQYLAAFVLYWTNYEVFRTSPLVYTLPATGIFQSLTAMYTFTFLPKKTVDQGYFSDKYTMNYPFVIENSFYALLLLFAFLYFDDAVYKFVKDTFFLEAVFVFFPYVIRQFWPKTSFRDSLKSSKARTARNEFFFRFAIQLTRFFYNWGYFLNYARYLDRISPDQTYHIHYMLLAGCFSVTIGIFLHTLKFRKMIGPRTSFVIYAASYLSSFGPYLAMFPIFYKNMDLTLITFGGLVLNYRDFKYQVAYQIVVFGLLICARHHALPDMIKEFLPLPVGQNVGQ